MKKMILFLILSAVLFGCTEEEIPEPKVTECSADSDCIKAGCSGQLCVPKGQESDMITTCEFRPEYGCLQYTSCSCIDGKCAFEDTAEYEQCLLENSDGDVIV